VRIEEISRSKGGGIRLDKITRHNEKLVGSIANYDLMISTNKTGNAIIYYAIADDNPIAAVMGKNEIFNNTKYFVILGVYVSPKYRGNNLGSDMYNFIMHDTQTNLMSDSSQTTGGRALWNTIAKTHNVGVYDINQEKIISTDIKDAYQNTDDENTVLVTINAIADSILIPTYKKKR
jgi:hypothetical protein